MTINVRTIEHSDYLEFSVSGSYNLDDAVDAYMAAWHRIGEVSGRAFNLGGGPANAVTLLQVLAEIGEITGQQAELRFSDWRPGDQRYFVADTRRAIEALGLGPALPWREGLRRLARWAATSRPGASSQTQSRAVAGGGAA